MNSSPGASGTTLLAETVISLAQAAAACPGRRTAARLAPSTIFRWLSRGVRAASGDRVRLEAVRLGGRWVTSSEALARFVRRLTSPDAGLIAVARPPSPHADRVAAELDRLGL